MKATKEEERLIMAEVAERIKDIVYMTAMKQEEQMLHSVRINELLNDPETRNPVIFTFRAEMCAGDIQQIVARHRRGREE